MSADQIAYPSLISQILQGDSEALYLPKAKLQKTKGNDPRWFIRPYIDVATPQGVVKKPDYIYLGYVSEMPKRAAETERRKVLESLSNKKHVLQAQLPFGDFLDIFMSDFVRRADVLSVGSRINYEVHVKNHIRPFFEKKLMSEITTRTIEQFFDQIRTLPRAGKEPAPPSWGMKHALKGMLSKMFTKAEDWGFWPQDKRNPVERAFIGREKFTREKRFLEPDDVQRILAEVPRDIAEILEVILSGTLRISEVLGLTWNNIDFAREKFVVCKRYYRGNVDRTKTQDSTREIPLGRFADILAMRYLGPQAAEEFVFNFAGARGVRRDERRLLIPLTAAAKKLGLYYRGFGFRAFRRQAITDLEQSMGMAQAMKMAGHTRSQTTQKHYILPDLKKQAAAVLEIQERNGYGKGPVQ